MPTDEGQTTPPVSPEPPPTTTQTITDPPPEPAKTLLEPEPKPESPPEPKFGLEALDSEKLTSLLPEGFSLDEATAPKFLEAINGASSREEFAKSVLGLQAELLASAEEAAAQHWTSTQDAWKEEVKADKEFGGEKLDTSLATARTLIETHLKPEEVQPFKEFMALTGAGNSVHFVRLLNRLSSAIPGEAKPVEGTPAATTPSRAERLFSKT